ncbi:MAG: D-amino acid aminotransferase [Gammaproteobacteria bacterium]|nr:D-amino acid aminotransferase [Gammaproteobacteria bacterium]MCK5669638.1 D-amino acid aminotransferase [Gammaproteobacteria bacterium]
MSSIVYLNGQYLPIEEAKISVLDRGFTFGDGIYEVIPVYNGHIFRLKEHIERLNNSLDEIFMHKPYQMDKWEKILHELLDKNSEKYPAEDQSIYMQVTRGVSERDLAIDIATEQTVFAMTRPLPKKDRSAGISAIVEEDIRWKYCHIKAITLLPSIVLRNKAKQSGATEALLIRDGNVTEGAASNVFIVKNGVVKTPVKDGSLLAGITRDLVVELLSESGIPCEEVVIKEAELRQADEIWITSSTWEIVPVIELDGVPVGTGSPGQVWQQACRIYQEFKIGMASAK